MPLSDLDPIVTEAMRLNGLSHALAIVVREAGGSPNSMAAQDGMDALAHTFEKDFAAFYNKLERTVSDLQRGASEGAERPVRKAEG